LDLELNVSNVISTTDNLPNTSKKFVKQSFHLTTNRLLVLTGLNKKELNSSFNEVPLLADIPFLGWLFKYESKDETKNNLSIVFELINEEDFTTDNFAILVPNTKF
jgi:general secretion pathway protein D